MIREIKSAMDRIFRNDINWNFNWLKTQDDNLSNKITSNENNIVDLNDKVDQQKNELIARLLDEIDTLNDRIDNLVAPTGNSVAEITDARVDVDGVLHTTLKERLDSKYIYGWDSVQNCRVRISFKDGAITSQKKVNNVWTDY